jgi:hypothetical protein
MLLLEKAQFYANPVISLLHGHTSTSSSVFFGPSGISITISSAAKGWKCLAGLQLQLLLQKKPKPYQTLFSKPDSPKKLKLYLY